MCPVDSIPKHYICQRKMAACFFAVVRLCFCIQKNLGPGPVAVSIGCGFARQYDSQIGLARYKCGTLLEVTQPPGTARICV